MRGAVPDSPCTWSNTSSPSGSAAPEAEGPGCWSVHTSGEYRQQVKPGDAESRIWPCAWGACCGESLGDRNPDMRLICDLGALIPSSAGRGSSGWRDGSVPHWLLGVSLPSAAMVTRSWPGGLSLCPGTSSRNMPRQETCLIGTKYYLCQCGFRPNFGPGSRLHRSQTFTEVRTC